MERALPFRNISCIKSTIRTLCQCIKKVGMSPARSSKSLILTHAIYTPRSRKASNFILNKKKLIKLMFGNIPCKMYTNQDIYIGIIVHYFSFQLFREWCDWNHRFHILPHCCSPTGTNRINEPSINNH